jgi:hypothetical protein
MNSDSDSNTMEMSEDTTQALIETMEQQIDYLKQEIETLKEANDRLKLKMRTFQSIIRSDILDKIFKYL